MTLLRIEKNNGIAIVSLNRPDKRNAMSFALLKELVRTAEKLKKDRSLRCVILTGEAKVFSAGIDLADLNNPQNRAFAAWELIKPGQSLFQKAFLVWQQLPVPVIAAKVPLVRLVFVILPLTTSVPLYCRTSPLASDDSVKVVPCSFAMVGFG